MEGEIHWRENNAVGKDMLKNTLSETRKEEDARNWKIYNKGVTLQGKYYVEGDDIRNEGKLRRVNYFGGEKYCCCNYSHSITDNQLIGSENEYQLKGNTYVVKR